MNFKEEIFSLRCTFGIFKCTVLADERGKFQYSEREKKKCSFKKLVGGEINHSLVVLFSILSWAVSVGEFNWFSETYKNLLKETKLSDMLALILFVGMIIAVIFSQSQMGSLSGFY